MVRMERHRKLESCGYLNFLFFSVLRLLRFSLFIALLLYIILLSKTQNREIEAHFSE